MIPTPDQAATLAWLAAAAAHYGVELDLEDAASDGVAREPCDHDTHHGPGVVCTPDGYLCLACAICWLAVRSGDLLSPEVLQDPAGTRSAA